MIVFLGDSITQAWPLDALQLSRTPINAGVSGETTTQMRGRFARDVAAQAPACLHFLGGINDIAENGGPIEVAEIEANIRVIVGETRARGIAVVLGTVLPARCVPWRPQIRPRPSISELNERLRRLSRELDGVVLADYFEVLVDQDGSIRGDATSDGLHLNELGYMALAPTTRRAIAAATGGP